MARYSWKGILRLSLVTVPVQAFNVRESGRGKITLNQLHDKDHSRIRYVKVCPVHGEVSNEEIVSGYEYAKDQYVVVDPGELDAMRTEAEKAINLDTFVAPDAIDDLYLDGRTYYLVPDGIAGIKPYGVLNEAMKRQNKYAIGQGVMFSREQLVLIRPHGELLAMWMLSYADEIRQPDGFEAGDAKVTPEELKLAETLIKASTAKKFDFSKYEDTYTHKLRALIEAKVAGHEIVAPPAEEQPAIVNLMDALKKSVARASGEPARAAKPPKKLAASQRVKTAAKTRKSS